MLVGEVIRLLLEAYYEPRFSDRSHGFRPRRGCHTALREVTDQWPGTTWSIEEDISAGRLNHSLKDSPVAGTFPPAGAALEPGATVDLLPTSPAEAPSGPSVDERIPTAVFAADEDGQDLTGLVPDLVGMFIISAEHAGLPRHRLQHACR